MAAILEQLGLDHTFFIQLGIFAILFFVLSPLYFKPFLKLFEARHKRTVEDREAAERLLTQAEAKFEEYRAKLLAERTAAKNEYELIVGSARKQESEILSQAREEAKKITHDAAESVNQQREQLKRALESDVDLFAQTVSERLLARKS